MSAIECAVCAWRATCNLKFRYESSELHCREYSRDVTLVAPVYAGGRRPAFYVANRAHHADVGGAAPGSMPRSTDLFQEGLRIPPVRLVHHQGIGC